MPLLQLADCTVRFGGLTAVNGLSLSIMPGELVGLIGPNGAGKTTVFNAITGVYRPQGGDIRFQGHSLLGRKPYQVCQAGIARTFQNIRLFGNFSVLDNVRAAARGLSHYTFADAVLRTEVYARTERQLIYQSLRLLRTFGLQRQRDQLACNLPYGDQRRLEIARAVATQPSLILLDEPAAGMNPQETQALMVLIQRLRSEFGLTILLIEHDMRVVMGICERVVVLDYGVAIAQGTPEQIRSHPAVIEAYLGEAE